MEYVGLQQQINRNNVRSVFLLIGFPVLLLLTAYGIIFFTHGDENGMPDMSISNYYFVNYIPFILIGTGIWFVVAYFGHNKMINFAAGSHPLERKTNMRVYNLTENLCMSVGLKMPQLFIIESTALNAFASGLNEKNYSVTVTRGLVDTLDDDELEGVIAHELMHIRNKDVRLLVISLIFVGIFSLLIQVVFRSVLYGGMRSSNNRKSGKDGGGGGMILILVITAVAYFLSLLFKLALSRKREYMADSGAAQMTKNPKALAGALRKISGNHTINDVKSDDIKEMFIENSPEEGSMGFLGGLGGLFSTHPPIEKRIKLLEQF